MRNRGRLPYTKTVRSKGRSYVYFVTGQLQDGKPILKRLPDKASPQFGATYAAMLAGRTRRESVEVELTLPRLIGLYQKSQKYQALKPSSRYAYDNYLRKLVEAFGDAPASQIERKDIVTLVDGMADKPGAANLILSITRALYAWGRGRDHVSNDPCRDIERFEVGEHQPWPESLVADALVSSDRDVRLIVSLLYYTAQRIGDVMALRWSDIRDGVIHIEQEKTGKPMTIRVHKDLAKLLGETPKRGITVITDESGRPKRKADARRSLQAFATARGFKVVPHGLRKNAVNTLLEVGCTVAETAAISGQSLQMIEHYAKRRSSEKLSTSAILRWENAK